MSVTKLGRGVYRVYWETQHGSGPDGWCEEEGVRYTTASDPDPEYDGELWPFQQAYLLILRDDENKIDLFEEYWQPLDER